MKLEEEKKKKLWHPHEYQINSLWSVCYYNEHKINSSQWNAQSTTHLLYLLTKNNRTIILHQGDTRGHGHCQHVSHTKVFLSLGVYQDIFLQGGPLSIVVTNVSPGPCCSLPGLRLGLDKRSPEVQRVRRFSCSGVWSFPCMILRVSPLPLHRLQA